MKTLLTARWIAPMNGPMLRDGAVVFDQRQIIALGAVSQIRSQHPDADVHELGDALVLPGLVNAHTHLELSDCQPGAPPADGFAGWLVDLILRTGLDAQRMEKLVAQAIAIAVEQCLRFGITTVGDISRQCHLSRPLLARSPLRVVSYGEVQAMAQRRVLLEQRLSHAIDTTWATERLAIGVTPHAPYSVEPQAYRRCLEVALQRNLPMTTHLAESAEEEAFLRDHSGEFMDLWNYLGRWDEHVPTFTGGPIRYAESLGLLDHPTLLAHVNYCDDQELAILARSRASVVYCPRTHAYFGHPPHRWREMLARGINVAVGTDSCASSPDLNIVDDLRLLHRVAPEVPPEQLWQMATVNAAKAIGLDAQAGAMAPGRSPDLAIYQISSDDPLREILQTPTARPTQVWCCGAKCPPAPA